MNEDILAIQFFLIFVGIFMFLSALYAFGTHRKMTFVVKEKGTLTHGYSNRNGGGSTWTNFMIYTRDNRALKNVNCLWFWKWRSTELQARIQKGKKYVADVYGWRIGAFNVYPNIVNVREIKDNSKKTNKKYR